MTKHPSPTPLQGRRCCRADITEESLADVLCFTCMFAVHVVSSWKGA